MTTTDLYAPPRPDVPNDALLDELAALRAQRARLIAYLREQRAGGATVVRIDRVNALLAARR